MKNPVLQKVVEVNLAGTEKYILAFNRALTTEEEEFIKNTVEDWANSDNKFLILWGVKLVKVGGNELSSSN